MNRQSILLVLFLLPLGAFLASCGGGGGGNTNSNGAMLSEPNAKEDTFADLLANSAEPEAFGRVIDSAVSGLRYKSGDHYGITDSTGQYGYIRGAQVEFYVGDIVIGAAIEPRSLITPYELGNRSGLRAINIASFLQALDNDADLDNGIQIIDAVHTLAAGETVDFSSSRQLGLVGRDSDFDSLILRLSSATEGGARGANSARGAFDHLGATISHEIDALGSQAKSVLDASTCELDTQCKVASLPKEYFDPCRPNVDIPYSEADVDFAAFEGLKAERDYLVTIKRNLSRYVWGTDNSTCSTLSRPTFNVCGEQNKCEIRSS